MGLLALTGCMTLEDRQARLDATCRGYGFTPGTDPYKNCWMTVDQANRRAALASAPVVCTPVGGSVVCQ